MGGKLNHYLGNNTSKHPIVLKNYYKYQLYWTVFIENKKVSIFFVVNIDVFLTDLCILCKVVLPVLSLL